MVNSEVESEDRNAPWLHFTIHSSQFTLSQASPQSFSQNTERGGRHQTLAIHGLDEMGKKKRPGNLARLSGSLKLRSGPFAVESALTRFIARFDECDTRSDHAMLPPLPAFYLEFHPLLCSIPVVVSGNRTHVFQKLYSTSCGTDSTEPANLRVCCQSPFGGQRRAGLPFRTPIAMSSESFIITPEDEDFVGIAPHATPSLRIAPSPVFSSVSVRGVKFAAMSGQHCIDHVLRNSVHSAVELSSR